MRHRKAGRKFNMDASARKAMLRNMVTSLMLHGRIQTTEARAKELRGVADKIITLGKKAPVVAADAKGPEADANRAKRVHAIRQARLWVNDRDAIAKVFGEYAEAFRDRNGGYTRVIKSGYRKGDNARMAYIELVGQGFSAAATPVETSAASIEAEAAAPAETAAEE